MSANEFYMFRKYLSGISIVLTWIMLAFALTGCGEPNPDPEDHNTEQSITSGARIAFSNNGITWTAVANTTFNDESDAILGIASVVWGNGIWVASNFNGKTAYSTNGITWTAGQNIFDGEIVIVNDIAYGNGKFIAVAGRRLLESERGRIAYSTNGINWTEVNTTFSNNRNIITVAWGNDRFIAGNSNGRIAHSIDGITWTAGPDSRVSGRAIAWGNGTWVAPEINISINYSTNNGGTWISVLAPGFLAINDIAWGNDKFVLVSQRSGGVGIGAIDYSTNGTNWVRVTLGDAFGFNNSTISNVIWGNGTWVASGIEGRMAYSSNGINWTAVTETPFSSIYDIAFGNGRFVAVGVDW